MGARSVWSEVKVTESCLTLCDPMDSIVHGILQARILEWAVFPFSRGSSQLRDWTQVSCIAGRVLSAELPGKAPGVCHSWKTKCITEKVLSTVSKCCLIGQMKLKLKIRYWINNLEVTDEPGKINSCTIGTKKSI